MQINGYEDNLGCDAHVYKKTLALIGINACLLDMRKCIHLQAMCMG